MGASHHQQHFVRDSKAGRAMGKSLKKMKGFKYGLVGGHSHVEAGDGLTRSGVFYVIGLGSIIAFLWLILN